MVIKTDISAKRSLAVLLFAGVGAGFINGLLGAGGGIILVYALSALNPDKSASAVRDNFASTIACILPISLVSAVIYSHSGTVDVTQVPKFILSAIAGGAAGALLMDKLSAATIKNMFAILLIIAGINMILR